MKQFLVVFYCVFFLLCADRLSAQVITITTSSTPTVCYNDGTLTVTAAGGTAPYTYTITAGPANPNLTYPITIPAGNNTFINLPHGSFTVVVTDAAGHTGTFTASVGGTYQFPGLNEVALGALGFAAYPTGGLPPLQFAMSSTSSSAGFGPYQSSDTFKGMCPGQYWVRVRDSCGNIFTTPYSYGYNIQAAYECVNYSKGTLNVAGLNGHAPYSYTFAANGDTVTNTTGNFTGLGQYSLGYFIVTDSCGVQNYGTVYPPMIHLTINCPFDGYVFGPGPAYGDTFTYICTNCSPVQTHTYTNPFNFSDTIFRNVGNPNPNIIVLSSQCGGDTFHTYVTANLRSLYIKKSYISCRSFSCSVVDSSGATVPADSFVIMYGTQRYAGNTTGLFFDLYANSAYGGTGYNILAFISGGVGVCIDTPRSYIILPVFNTECGYTYEDSNCQSKWLVRLPAVPSPEVFSLAQLYTNDTFTMVPYQGYDYAYNVPPYGTFTLISDSGCSKTVYSPPFFNGGGSATTPCVGNTRMYFEMGPMDYCAYLPTGNPTGLRYDTFELRLYNQNRLILDTVGGASGIYYNPIDSGWFYYKFYQKMRVGDPALVRYDSICPVYSDSIYVNLSHVPFPYSTIAYTACDSQLNHAINYQIYGGSFPYTVQIPGFDTVTLYGNTAVFPTRHTGTYTMIVYDNCGISRSFTFSIIDTCPCPHALVSLPDTVQCLHDTVQLISTSTGAVSYQWLVNGQLYSRHADTTLIVTAGGDNILLRAYSYAGCMDSVSFHILDTCSVCPHAAISLPDTLSCIGDTVQLISTSTGASTYQWLVNGNLYSRHADTTLITTAGGDNILLRAFGPAGCKDSASFHIRDTCVGCPHAIIAANTDTLACAGATVQLNSVSTHAVSYQWLVNGQLYSRSADTVLIVTAGGDNILLRAFALEGCKDSTFIYIRDTCAGCPHAAIAPTATLFCAGDTVHLSSSSTRAVSYQWLVNGSLYSRSADTILIVAVGGDNILLRAFALEGCMDSAVVHISDTCSACPTAVISLADTVVCAGDTVLLVNTSIHAVSYQWLVDGQPYSRQADTIFITTAGGNNILLRVLSITGCSDSAFIHIRDSCAVCPHASLVLPDTVSCFGDTVHLTSTSISAVSYQWLVNGQLYSSSADTTLIITAGGDNILLRAFGREGCVDSVSIHIRDSCSACPVAAISTADTISCAGDTVPLISTGTGAVSYQWLVNGSLYSRAADTTLITSSGGDLILLRVYSAVGCADSAYIHVSGVSPYFFDLGMDTVYCDNFSRVLSTGVASTHWSTGQTGSQITVSTPGTYSAIATNECGSKTDTITIRSQAVPGMAIAASRLSLCIDRPDSALLSVSVDSSAGARVSFVWSTGQIDTGVYSSLIRIDSAGTYTVIAESGVCRLSRSEVISAVQCDTACPFRIAIPDAFSPNGDQMNEEFKVVYTCPVKNFSMQIFDRWGQLMYESTDINSGWDGMYKGQRQPEDVYVWFICADSKTNKCQTGTVTLLR